MIITKLKEGSFNLTAENEIDKEYLTLLQDKEYYSEFSDIKREKESI